MDNEKSKRVGICVYGASSSRIAAAYTAAARQLGSLIAAKGWDCINGAGSHGLMRAASDGALDAGGTATGVIPQFMVDNGWSYSRLTRTIVTTDMHQRKRTMASMASAFVAMPGGCGTIEELMEVFTWIQLGIIDSGKPLVVLNTGGYYNHLIAQVEQSAADGFMKPSHRSLWHIAATPQQAVEAIERAFGQGPQPVESKY